MDQPTFGFDVGNDPMTDLLTAKTAPDLTQAKAEALARRDRMLAALEGHSPAFIVEKALLMARAVLIEELEEDDPTSGKLGEKLNAGDRQGLVLAGDPLSVMMKLIARVQNTLGALSEMALDAHKVQRPDEHDPDCEYRNGVPKEEN